jgi:glucokinase
VVSILADIGGTNIRFATLNGGGKTGAVEAWLTALYPDFASAFHAYAELTGAANPHAVAICAAGPLVQGRIKMTNCPWELDQTALTKSLKTRVLLLNDFAALAHAVPALQPEDLRHLGGAAPDPNGQKLIMGPGTGLGVAGLAPLGKDGWKVLTGEGGHVTLSPQNPREIALVYQLQQMFGHVSLERVLSGPGLENLMLAIAAIDGVSFKEKPRAEDILARADKGDPSAQEAMTQFTAWLGGAAGDAALTLGATGGVYIAGGILPQWGDAFDAKLFRHRFEAKGRMRDYLAPIPTALVTAKDLAFRGLAHALKAAVTNL